MLKGTRLPICIISLPFIHIGNNTGNKGGRALTQLWETKKNATELDLAGMSELYIAKLLGQALIFFFYFFFCVL